VRGTRDAAKLPAVVVAVATAVGISLSIAAPDVLAGGLSHAAPATTTPSAPAGGAPTATINATIGGLATGTPNLRFSIETHGGFPVTAVTVALPSGLSFSKKATDLAHGVRVGTDTPQSSVRQGQLTVTLDQASAHFQLTIAGAAMTESASLENAVRKVILFNEAHMTHQRALPLKLALTVNSGPHAAIKVADTIAFR